MSGSVVLDAAGRRRSPATMPGFHAGHPPRHKGVRYPADRATVEDIVAVMRIAGDGLHGRRLRGLIVVLWRAGLRIDEALALGEATALPPVARSGTHARDLRERRCSPGWIAPPAPPPRPHECRRAAHFAGSLPLALCLALDGRLLRASLAAPVALVAQPGSRSSAQPGTKGARTVAALARPGFRVPVQA
jgi:hypothetical protein